MTQWLSFTARIILGSVLLIAGALKLPDLRGSVEAVNAYEILPYSITPIVGYGLPMVEIIIGLLLIVGLFTRISAIMGALLMVIFIIGISSAWARGLTLDCGCFGGGGKLTLGEKPQYLQDIIRDLLLMGCGVFVAIQKTYKFAVDDLFNAKEQVTG